MDALVQAVYEKVVAKLDDEKETSMALPFSLSGKNGIAYLPLSGNLAAAKASIAQEWLAMHPVPFPCRLDPEEVTEIKLASKHILNERDQLSIVLSKIDPYHIDHFASITCAKRYLTLHGLPGQVLLDNDQAVETVKNSDSSAPRDVMQVELETTVGNLNNDKCWKKNAKFPLFTRDPEMEYLVTGVLVLDVETSLVRRFELDFDYPLLYSLAECDKYRVFPLWSVAKRPLWKAFFDHVEEWEESQFGQQLVHYVRIRDPMMVDWFKAKLALSVFYSSDTPLVKCNMLIRQIANMRSYGQKSSGINHLIDWLEIQYEDLLKPIKAMIAEGNITYDALWYLFPNGCRIAVPCEESWVLLTANNTNYVEQLENPCFSFYGKVLCSNGLRYYKKDRLFVIPGFSGVVSIDSLPVRTPQSVPDVEKLCMQQFEQFEQYALGYRQANCEGLVNKIGQRVNETNLQSNNFKSTAESSFYHKGRVVVDLELYARSGHQSSLLEISINPESIKVLTDETKMSVWPFLPVFSLSSKAWLRVHCNSLSPIDYQVSAFSKVVMHPARKQLLESVVDKYADRKVCDIVAGKNLGCCLLLYGPPGTGKTLTCEAVAEKLKQPLYSVSVGELGIDPSSVETNLSQVFRVAARWNAVLLIDEADIFMEQRSHTEIKRNSLVAVFLKMLEYYEGILFLTTNRVGNFDEAILSRMMLVLQYTPLVEQERKQIWSNQLRACGADPEQFEPRISEIANLQLNGRDINRLISLANILAAAEASPLALKHLDQAIEATNRVDLPKIAHHLDNEESPSRRTKLE